MKKRYCYSFCSLIAFLMVVGCGNNEDDPGPVDCSISPISILTDTTEENCGLADGVIEVIASGGQGDLSYSIDGGRFFKQQLFLATLPVVHTLL